MIDREIGPGVQVHQPHGLPQLSPVVRDRVMDKVYQHGLCRLAPHFANRAVGQNPLLLDAISQYADETGLTPDQTKLARHIALMTHELLSRQAEVDAQLWQSNGHDFSGPSHEIREPLSLVKPS